MTPGDDRAELPEPIAFARPMIDEDEIDAVVEVLRSGWLTTGPKSREFEAAFAAVTGAEESLALSSGTAALHLGLVASGVGPGDLVFTTPTTFCSTVHVIEHVGATPVLVDVEPSTLNIDPAALADAIHSEARAGQGRPRAVIPVHYAGQPCDMDAILDLARSNDLSVVEDAAHAFGASYRGREIGTVDATVRDHSIAFSLYATKNITTGEGGVLNASSGLLDEARTWSLHGMSRDAWKRYVKGGSWRYDVLHPGFKYNFTDIQAALGLAQLGKGKALLARRTQIAQRYTEAFELLDELQTPATGPDVVHAWHLYVLRLHEKRLQIGRDDLIDELVDLGIGISVHFIPLHHHTYYREKYGWPASDVPVSEREFHRMLSLPIYPRMMDADVERVVAVVTDVVQRHARVAGV